MVNLIVVPISFIVTLIVPVLGNISPGCLHSEGQLDLTSFPVGGTPISWIMSPGSSLFATPDYLPVTVPPYCESVHFRVPSFQRHLNTTFIGNNILVTEKVTTTQELARDFVGLMGLVVVADQQTRGKARGGQSWSSPSGDVYMSINVNLTDRGLFPLLQSIAALSVVNSVHEKQGGYQDIDLAYVWPNSVAWNNRKVKLAGVIVEQSPIDDSWFIIGIGIRLGSVSGVSTLNSIVAAHNHMFGTKLEPITREELVARVLNNLETLVEMLQKNQNLVRDLLASNWVSKKKTVHLSFNGIVTGINSNNELVVKDSHGIQVFIHPDLHIVSADDTIVSSPISYSSANLNSVYEAE
ncbi:biotin--protein ligase-like [Panonychus citri]|uniref:biotin--protein ligase-like n=1 Tax=Panonychus citri TaxID=50023 RepID=UPI002307CDA4|nr:biotin--protein ligase-like [Panonychus citri]